MKKLVLGLVLFFALGAVAQQAGPPPDLEIPSNMKHYFVALLVANDKSAKAHDDHELVKKHLAFIRSQVEAGKFVVVGPYTDNGKIAGMAIVDVPTLEEVKTIMSVDPMVTSGMFDMEIHSAMLEDLSVVKIVYPNKKPQ
jgi:uncharacterized protein YciI